MRSLLLSILLTSLLQAANPQIYAGLGDKLYDAMPAVAALGMTDAFRKQKAELDSFIAACAELKEAGLDIDARTEGHMDKKAYLKVLRERNKTLGKFMLQAHRVLREAIETDDYATFRSMIETGIVDIEAYDYEILEYYAKHKADGPINELEYYKAFKAEQRKVSAERTQQRNANYKAYREQRIERFRERDKREKEAFKEALKSEMQESKKAAAQELEKELILP